MKTKRRKQRTNWNLLILAIPGLIFLFAFYFIPLVGLVIPFKQIDYALGIFGSPWVGWSNFEFFFQSQDAIRVTRNTLVLNAIFIVVTMIV